MAKIALRQQAERLLPYTDGKFSPSPPPAALENLTDELVVVAAEVVGIIGAGLGVNARFRLLSWVVADARGAQVVMEPNLALTVGKRLERQAESVRAKLQGILGRWRDERARIGASRGGTASQ